MWFSPLLQGAGQQQAAPAGVPLGAPIAGIPALGGLGGASPLSSGPRLFYWNGSAWVQKPLKRWNGTAWVVQPLKRWNGTAWV